MRVWQQREERREPERGIEGKREKENRDRARKRKNTTTAVSLSAGPAATNSRGPEMKVGQGHGMDGHKDRLFGGLLPLTVGGAAYTEQDLQEQRTERAATHQVEQKITDGKKRKERKRTGKVRARTAGGEGCGLGCGSTLH